jgi:hypothetical protein
MALCRRGCVSHPRRLEDLSCVRFVRAVLRENPVTEPKNRLAAAMLIVICCFADARADVVYVSHLYHWEKYECAWTEMPGSVAASCSSTSTIEFERDPDNLFISRMDAYPGDWTYAVYVDGVDTYDGIGCSYFRTSVDGDPNGAFLQCP